MRKTIFIRKGLAILLTAAMVAGLVPGMGTMQVSAAESDENTVDTVSSNDAVIQNQTDEQATDKCIITWQWIDEEENLNEETGNLALPGASEQRPVYFDDVTAFLPTEIQATVVNEEDSDVSETGAEEIIILADWSCDNYPKEGAYSGSYTFTAALPEGYTLFEEAEALEVLVELGGVQIYESTGVSYLSCDSDGRNWTTATCDSATEVKSTDTEWGESEEEKWYVVSGTVIIDSRVEVKGTVHLILEDNCNLTIHGGIGVTEDNRFTIYAQSDGTQMGCLTIQDVHDKNAGIGGSFNISGKITINGGNISSTSRSGAAIGGASGWFGDVTINGGVVTAICSDFGAGIGNGYCGGKAGGVVINGGVVTASSNRGAGIGGGYKGEGIVTIKGGMITATSANRSGIGSASSSPASKVTITNSPVIFASSISDQSGKDNNTWGGIIFEGDSGKAYGTLVTVDADCTIPSGKNLEVSKDQTISIADTKTFTNEGTIYNSGTFTGTVTNIGTIHNAGTFGEELGGAVYNYTISSAENSNCQLIYVSLNVNDTVFEETVTYEVIDNESNVEIENGNTLKIINRDEIGDIVPVTAIFAVDDIRMTKTENIDIPEHKFPAEFDEDGFKSCYECGKEVYQSAEVVSDTHHPELKDHYADYYAIENAGQLYWFAGLVNGDPSVCAGDVTQNPSANAVLTKSITVNEGVLESDGTLVDSVRGFKSWTPIGNYRVNDVSYAGTFDGQGFNVSGLYCATDNEQVGFVGNSSGIIKNLGITDSYFNGKESVGAVCGYNFSGVIINCFSACYIDAAGNNAGGICGTNAGSISNCYNIGSVIANSDAHSICGKNNNDGGIIINCFFLDTKPGDSYATGKPEELFNSGEVAYLLSQGTDGESWGQKLGDDGDTYPVLKKTGDEGNTVYQYTNCEGNMSYTNDSALSGIVQNHDFSEQGICSNCNHEFSKSDLLEYISQFSEVVEADYSDATFLVYSNAKTEAERLAAAEVETSAADLYRAFCELKSAYEALKPVALTIEIVSDPSDTGKQTGGGRYAVGETVILTAEVVEGWAFNGWYDGDKLVSDKEEVTFTVTEDMSGTVSYTAKYTHVSHIMDESSHTCSVCGINYYKVTFIGDEHCVLTVTDSSGNTVVNGDEVAAGTILKVSVKVDEGYTLITAPESSYTVNEAITITAVTEAKTYVVTVDDTYYKNGEAEAPTANVTDLSAVPYGTSLTLTAADANSGYAFLGWYQTDGEQLTVENVYTVTITSDLTVQPRYQMSSGIVTSPGQTQISKLIADYIEQVTEAVRTALIKSGTYDLVKQFVENVLQLRQNIYFKKK